MSDPTSHRPDHTADESAFLGRLADRLAELPGVEAVSLGGSRAQGTNRPDSDWDLSIYYRGEFDPRHLRDVGWPGEVAELGAWGGGVFNGGAWLEVDGRPVDIHYRDLNSVEHELAEAREGRFRIERLMFHLAGIPSYIVVGELAINQILRGDPPRPTYPEALREKAPAVWWSLADLTFGYATTAHAAQGRLAQCAATLTVATSYAAHAILSARGEWTTNEKTLLTQAGLANLDEILANLTPADLPKACTAARALAAAARP
ncbi:nucleotidyltransferase domain-containing protein [Kribbella sp. NBC_01245]|uniref:nucleotidyltransferase domain-containing protein n=1 Tax=Kribbella sp. NBC_01245 TaxID=2903578 RepID=UPI002E2E64BD|nr:nucleotidyltransferase domain-containing protein [Kribbella sp. NBC_01245]